MAPTPDKIATLKARFSADGLRILDENGIATSYEALTDSQARKILKDADALRARIAQERHEGEPGASSQAAEGESNLGAPSGRQKQSGVEYPDASRELV